MRTPPRIYCTALTCLRVFVVWVGLTAGILTLAFFALWLGARAYLRPSAADWATTLRAGPLELDVGTSKLVEWGTTPWIAQRLDGHTLHTRVGELPMTWDKTAQQLNLHCKPCTLRSRSWGSEPLRLAEARVTLQRHDSELTGTLASGALQAHWRGSLRPTGMTLQITLPESPLRDAYGLFANAIPEVAKAQIAGTVALHATLELPSQVLTVQPHLNGMAVSGLGTENWMQVQNNCARDWPKVNLGLHNPLVRAVIAAEDQRFFEHTGYDLAEMTIALHSNQTTEASLRGASTLTQQVAKLLVTGGERSPVRKMRELLYAVEMEQTLGKARILHLYLDLAPWGAKVCGAHAAAHTYFGTSANQLTTAQAVWLAALLHNPDGELQRWQATGQINLARAHWVAASLRPMRKAQRDRVITELATVNWESAAWNSE